MNESKYEIRGDQIVNRASGEAIPDDEPVFIFRARDRRAAAALHRYADDVEDPVHARAVLSDVEAFARFARDNPHRMKEPDTDVSAIRP